MALGTYTEPFATVRDELRCLFQDNETDGTTLVPDAVVSDAVYNSMLTDKGTLEGAIWLAMMYASYYALQVKRYAEAGGTSVEWVERQKFYSDMAEAIRTGRVKIGVAATGVGVQRGVMTAGLEKDSYYNKYGYWPEKKPATVI